jgi:ADP-heptose:LPS heptosyltransferase
VKALFVAPVSVAAIIHTLPMLPVLTKKGWDVTYLTKGSAAQFLAGHSEVAAVVTAPRWIGGALRTAEDLREGAFDAAFDLKGVWSTAAWARFSKPIRTIGHSRSFRRHPLSAILIREPVDVPEDVRHVVDRNLSLLRVVGVDAIGVRQFPLPSSESEAAKTEHFLRENAAENYILLSPGGGWSSRLWGYRGFGEVARGLKDRGMACLVSHEPGEERLAETVVAASDGAAKACPPTSLRGFMEFARRARVVVAADTGALHLACAMGVPVVGIYGPTDPTSSGPFDPRDVVVRRTPLCSPCFRDRCKIHDGVMEAITPSDVLRAIERRLGIASLQRSRAV